ncbi:Hypothetical protein R9X50_00321000 [Acrodontium crateriforme]|uniref:PNPLA domain-containing protein n=1 Tax=Acrodontium crateriforme TaxID=150365 RepID=A0AAQ3M5B3_9PEZI|nr:Hypothetical protein R9X50_00321000 [Acrodontium crateriforme]
MDSSGQLRRKDTTKGPPLRILCLDGGGVRGYSMLIILQELMHRTFVEIEGRAPKRHEIPKPCDHFDLISGTGTGGLIAIMLGRLRLDLDTCKEVYVRMTRRVFETDKTFAGIPYKSTMFKASKLEEAIRECVREHTVFEDEGNDTLANAVPMTPDVPGTPTTSTSSVPKRTFSQGSRYSQIGMSPVTPRSAGFGSLRWGNSGALLYDTRENRTKTAVTAVLKGTSSTTLLRSYDSRKETAPDVNCTIWQAGRATSAAAMAFKPITIGQSTYLDEGAGKYNPAPLILDEAIQNEWPGREVGVFISIGTGKRPSGLNQGGGEWWEGFLGGTMGDYAEARRRLVAKMEGCEETHQFMLREHLAARGVSVDNYFRLNVEIGVGEFGMNEWARLSEISTNTRLYLAQRDVEQHNYNAAIKLARIYFAKFRHDRVDTRHSSYDTVRPFSWDQQSALVQPPANPNAVELPGNDGDIMYANTHGFRPTSFQRDHRDSFSDQKFTVFHEDGFPHSPNLSQHTYPSPRESIESYRRSLASSKPTPPTQIHPALRSSPPPLPPKTPLPYPDQNPTPAETTSPNGNHTPNTFINMGNLGRRLPYPDVDEPAPQVNLGSKPSLAK